MNEQIDLTEKKARPNGSAWVVIVCPETDEVLLGKRAKEANNSGQWNLFGGGVEPGESAIQTALRELWEEAGVRVNADALRLLGRTSAGITIFVLELTAARARSAIRLNKLEVSKVKWFSMDDLPANLHKSTLGLLQMVGHSTVIDHENERDGMHPGVYAPVPSMRGMMDMVERASKPKSGA